MFTSPNATMLLALVHLLTTGLVNTFYVRRLKLDFLCTPPERGPLYVRDLPWDCAGYVICMNGRAVPTACPQGLWYQGGQSKKCVPIDSNVTFSHCHGVIWDYIHTICRFNPVATVPDAAKCSQYLDCSMPSTGHDHVEYLLECPYPNLYSTQTGACQHYRRVSCGERMEPKAPCDYSQFQQLYGCADASCQACAQHHPSCVGLSNGRHTLATPESNVSVECHSERTLNAMTSAINRRVGSGH